MSARHLASQADSSSDAACAGAGLCDEDSRLILRGQLPLLEALLLCVQHQWMALLVGLPSTGTHATSYLYSLALTLM